MPHRWRPPSWTVTPARHRGTARSSSASASDPCGDGVHPEGEGVVDGRAEAEPHGHRGLEGHEPLGPVLEPVVVVAVPGGRAPVDADGPEPVGEPRPHVDEPGAPRARAATCVRCRSARRSRSLRRRPAAGRCSGSRRRRSRRRPSRQSRAASATGLTRPRWVPTWVRLARATSPPASAAASASRSSVPSGVLGTASMVVPATSRHLDQAQVVAVVGDAVDEDPAVRPEPAPEEEAPQRLGPALGVGAGHRHLVADRSRAARQPTPGPRPPGRLRPPRPRSHPISASSRRWSMTVSRVAVVGRAAPALLRWATVRACPGWRPVRRRRRWAGHVGTPADASPVGCPPGFGSRPVGSPASTRCPAGRCRHRCR